MAFTIKIYEKNEYLYSLLKKRLISFYPDAYIVNPYLDRQDYADRFSTYTRVIYDPADINIADRLWQENPLQNSSDLTDSYYLKELLLQLKNSEWQFEMKDLAIDGEKLMKHFEFEPSRLVWELLHQAFDWVLTDINGRNNEKEIFNYLDNYIKNRKKIG